METNAGAAANASWLLHDSAVLLDHGDCEGTGGRFWLPPHDNDDHEYDGIDGVGVPPPPPPGPPPKQANIISMNVSGVNISGGSDRSAEQPSWLHLPSSPAGGTSNSLRSASSSDEGSPVAAAPSGGRVSARFASALNRSVGDSTNTTAASGAKVLQARAQAKSLLVGKKKAPPPPPPPGPPPGPPPPRRADGGKKKGIARKDKAVVPPPPPPGPPPAVTKGKTAAAGKISSSGNIATGNGGNGGGSGSGGRGGLGGIFRRGKAQASQAQAQKLVAAPPLPPPPASLAPTGTGTPRNAAASGNANGNANTIGVAATATTATTATPSSAGTVRTAPSTGRMTAYASSSSSSSSSSAIAGRSAYRRRSGDGALGGFLSPEGSGNGGALPAVAADRHGAAGFVSPPAAATALGAGGGAGRTRMGGINTDKGGAAVGTTDMVPPPPPPPPLPQTGAGASTSKTKIKSARAKTRSKVGNHQRTGSGASPIRATRLGFFASPRPTTSTMDNNDNKALASPSKASASASASVPSTTAPATTTSTTTPPVVRRYRHEREQMEERHRTIRRNRSVETAPAMPSVAAVAAAGSAAAAKEEKQNTALATDATTASATPGSARSVRSSARRSWGQSVREYHNGGSSSSSAISAGRVKGGTKTVRKDATSPPPDAAAAPGMADIVEEADNSSPGHVATVHEEEEEEMVDDAVEANDSSMMRSIMSVNDDGEVEVSVSQFSRVSASSSASASTSTSSRWGQSVRGGAGSSSRWGGGGGGGKERGAARQKTKKERREPEPTSSTIPPPPPPPPVPAHLLSADRHVARVVLLQSVARRWLVQRRLEREAAVEAMCNETVDTIGLLNTTPIPVSSEKPDGSASGAAIPPSLLGKFGFDDSNEVEDSLLLMGGVDSSIDHSCDIDGGLTARRLEREQREAATVIQTAQRASVERKKYVQLLSKREDAAISIQASARAASVRRDFGKTIEAAVVIQSLARGAAKRREVEQRHRAATTIQAHVRGMAGREEVIRYCTLIEQTAAATRIQSSYRGSKQRHDLAKEVGAVVGIQALARGSLERKSLVRQTEAATAIQAFASASLGRKATNDDFAKKDRAERIAKAEAEAKRLQSTSPVDDDGVNRGIPVLSSTSVDSTSGSDDEEGLVGSDASCSDAPSIDINNEIAQAFDIGQQALRSAPEKEEESAIPISGALPNKRDVKEAQEEIDEANISKAKHFLTHPSTVSLPMEEKTKYLLSKGLNESEIKASVEAVAEELILEQGLLYDDTGAKVTLETSLNVKNDELKQKETADTESNASDSTAAKSSLDLPRGDAAEDTFDFETKANKSGLNTSVLSQTLNKSIEKMKQVDVNLPSCCCLPSHLPNRVVAGLLLFVILLAVGLYLIYTFAVGSFA